MDKVNSHALSFQSKCGILIKSKKLSEYHPTSIQTPKKLQKRFIYIKIYIRVNLYFKSLLKLWGKCKKLHQGTKQACWQCKQCLHGTKETSLRYWTRSLAVKQCQAKGEVRNTHWIPLSKTQVMALGNTWNSQILDD